MRMAFGRNPNGNNTSSNRGNLKQTQTQITIIPYRRIYWTESSASMRRTKSGSAIWPTFGQAKAGCILPRLRICTAAESSVGRCISGWRNSLWLNALHQAVARQHPPRDVILHSNRGVQYAAKKYRNVLKSYVFHQSMSRKGDCWVNAPMESFFGTLKTELVYHENYKTRAEARTSIFDYVEAFYNRIRLQKWLG